MTYEGFRNRILKSYRKATSSFRKKKLKNDDFTIISNNCWGGMVYESYSMEKRTPTVGGFFMADEYIKFCSDLEKYLSAPLSFIDPKSSKYAKELATDARFGSYPIALIGDVEYCFLHYHSEQEAREKWERRCKRVDLDKLIVKFNDQNGCEQRHVEAFSRLPLKHKLFFTIKEWNVENKDGFYRIKQYTKDRCVTASHEPMAENRYFDLTKLINEL